MKLGEFNCEREVHAINLDFDFGMGRVKSDCGIKVHPLRYIGTHGALKNFGGTSASWKMAGPGEGDEKRDFDQGKHGWGLAAGIGLQQLP